MQAVHVDERKHPDGKRERNTNDGESGWTAGGRRDEQPETQAPEAQHEPEGEAVCRDFTDCGEP